MKEIEIANDDFMDNYIYLLLMVCQQIGMQGGGGFLHINSKIE